MEQVLCLRPPGAARFKSSVPGAEPACTFTSAATDDAQRRLATSHLPWRCSFPVRRVKSWFGDLDGEARRMGEIGPGIAEQPRGEDEEAKPASRFRRGAQFPLMKGRERDQHIFPPALLASRRPAATASSSPPPLNTCTSLSLSLSVTPSPVG